MLQYLDQVDTALLLWLNGLHTAVGDAFMPLYTDKWVWLPLYLVMIVYLWYRYGAKQILWLVGALIVCAALSDLVSSSLIKPLVERPRPTRVPELEGVLHIVNGYRSGRYGFVSSHAANTFGIALFFTLITRDRLNAVVLFAWSLLNCYSRIYLGVHYPGDILGGFVVGTLMACLCYALLRRVRPHAVIPVPRDQPLIMRLSITLVWMLTVLVLLLIAISGC